MPLIELPLVLYKDSLTSSANKQEEGCLLLCGEEQGIVEVFLYSPWPPFFLEKFTFIDIQGHFNTLFLDSHNIPQAIINAKNYEEKALET